MTPVSAQTCPKANSFRFDDPYEHIHHMENTHEDTYLIDAQEQDMKKMMLNKTNSTKIQMMT